MKAKKAKLRTHSGGVVMVGEAPVMAMPDDPIRAWWHVRMFLVLAQKYAAKHEGDGAPTREEWAVCASKAGELCAPMERCGIDSTAALLLVRKILHDEVPTMHELQTVDVLVERLAMRTRMPPPAPKQKPETAATRRTRERQNEMLRLLASDPDAKEAALAAACRSHVRTIRRWKKELTARQQKRGTCPPMSCGGGGHRRRGTR